MIELQLPDLPVIFPLLESAVKLYNLPEFLDVDHIMSEIDRGLQTGRIVVLVDDIGTPRTLMVGSVDDSATYKGKRFTVIVSYIHPENRNPGSLRILMGEIEKCAKKHECKVLFGSSWAREGDEEKASDKLWSFFKYKRQEIIYAKVI